MKRNMMIGIVIVLVIIVGVFLYSNQEAPSEFSVKYKAFYSSPGGDRSLEIIYVVLPDFLFRVNNIF